jgi:ABC-type sugar transport system substrate-binding protein
LLRDAYVEIDAGSPEVRMLAAAVAKARARDLPVLVLATPIPIDLVTTMGVATTADVEAAFQVVAEAVRDAGGTLLDLHDKLRTADFRDNAGHFNPDGARRMAALVAPEVFRIVMTRERTVEPRCDESNPDCRRQLKIPRQS